MNTDNKNPKSSRSSYIKIGSIVAALLLAVFLYPYDFKFLKPKYDGGLTREIVQSPELLEQYFLDKLMVGVDKDLGKAIFQDAEAYLKEHPEDRTLLNLNLRKVEESASIKHAVYGSLYEAGVR